MQRGATKPQSHFVKICSLSTTFLTRDIVVSFPLAIFFTLGSRVPDLISIPFGRALWQTFFNLRTPSRAPPLSLSIAFANPLSVAAAPAPLLFYGQKVFHFPLPLCGSSVAASHPSTPSLRFATDLYNFIGPFSACSQQILHRHPLCPLLLTGGGGEALNRNGNGFALWHQVACATCTHTHIYTHIDGPIQQRRRFLCVVGKWKHANPL